MRPSQNRPVHDQLVKYAYFNRIAAGFLCGIGFAEAKS
jgi:hypothetical protein